MKAKKYLKGGQVKLDANKDGKISGKDFSMLRKGMKKYQKGGKAPKGEIDLGKTAASRYNLSLKDAEEMVDRVEKNYGRHASDVRTGVKGIDDRQDREESYGRQARARAGSSYYDGDGGGAGRSEKAYADRLGERVLLRMGQEKVKAKQKKRDEKAKQKGLKAVDTYNKSSAKMKSGGKVVKYQKGGKASAAMAERERKLEAIRENSRLMKEERALRQRQGFAKRLQGKGYDGGASGGFTQQEMEVFDRIRENGFTKPIDKSKL